MRKNLNKSDRQKVYDKYLGHCAYCGRLIDYKNMQVDHLIPLMNWDGTHTDEELWSMDNLMPSCRICNHYKRANSLETFREMIETIPSKLYQRNYIFKVGVTYGFFYEQPRKMEFYFEQWERLQKNRRQMPMSKSMTPERVRDNFVQNLAENAYLNMCTTEEMNVVISALEKQIPKKPEPGTTNAYNYVCPNCGGPVGSLEVEEIWCDFCPKCGQAIDKSLDWSDSDE